MTGVVGKLYGNRESEMSLLGKVELKWMKLQLNDPRSFILKVSGLIIFYYNVRKHE